MSVHLHEFNKLVEVYQKKKKIKNMRYDNISYID